RYRMQSFQKLTFTDWALTARYFGAGRQAGLSIHNGYNNPSSWGYVIGVMDGVNARASFGTGIARAFGTKVTSRTLLADGHGVEEFHPEVFIHSSYKSQDMNIKSDTDEKGGSFRYSTSLSIAWDPDPVPFTDYTLKTAFDFLCKMYGLSFFTSFYLGFAELNETDYSPALAGYLLLSAYRLNQLFDISLRYAAVDYFGDLVQAVRQQSPGTNQNTRLLQEITAGFNVYIVGHQVKWQHDAGLIFISQDERRNPDILIRSQVLVSF
ncbi:MAG: hypothetical protein HQK83_16410, partial [Fibrobacteria bacterium]|nr:hypothetical protein [Fibrobacteria bacterium]